MVQSELEHRIPKSRYKRTSRKKFIKQLTEIEWRQARLRRIRQKLNTREMNRTRSDPADNSWRLKFVKVSSLFKLTSLIPMSVVVAPCLVDQRPFIFVVLISRRFHLLAGTFEFACRTWSIAILWMLVINPFEGCPPRNGSTFVGDSLVYRQ